MGRLVGTAGAVTGVLLAVGGCAAVAGERPTASPAPGAEEAGPAVATELLTHCGIRTVVFADRTWTAVEPAPEPDRLPDAAGVVTYTGHTAGELVLLDDDELRFTVRDPLSAADGESFDFVPVPDGTAPEPACA